MNKKTLKRRMCLLLTSLLLMSLHAAATPASLSIEDFSIKAGETKEMLIDLNNPNDQITLVQFDMRLPEGLSIAVVDDEPAIDIAGRTTWRKHSLESSNNGETIRFLLYSSSNAVLSGTSGAIISVTLQANSNFNGGSIQLENILLVTPEQGETKPDTYVYTIEGESIAVSTITLNKTSCEITQGNTVQLTATVSPTNATDKSVKWSSNKTSVATVDNNGLVTGVAAGSAVITCEAKDGSGVKATCNITVKSQSSGNNIQFADAEVKRICVENWDTDGDGELSKDEAAAVTSLDKAFVNNSQISSFDELEFFTGLLNIGNGEFYGCSSLTSITIPPSVTSIGSSTFNGCSSLVSVTIPSSVTSIGGYAFANCSSLTSITIPSSVTNIEFGWDCAFAYCDNLRKMTVAENNPSYRSKNNGIIDKSTNMLVCSCPGTKIPTDVVGIGEYGFSHVRGVEEIVIPNNIKRIGEYAFSNSLNLKRITIPFGIESIGDFAFYGCTELEQVAIYNPIPVNINDCVFYVSEDGILSSLFGIRYTFTDATLYVPYGSKTQYEQANGWKNFKSIIEMDALSGDVNSDGQVGIGDIVAVTNVMAGNGGNITEAQADVNGDGQVGIGDIVAITNIMAGVGK